MPVLPPESAPGGVPAPPTNERPRETEWMPCPHCTWPVKVRSVFGYCLACGLDVPQGKEPQS